jgi:hypothetical protein
MGRRHGVKRKKSQKMQRRNSGFKKKIQNTEDIEIMTGAQYAALMTEDGVDVDCLEFEDDASDVIEIIPVDKDQPLNNALVWNSKGEKNSAASSRFVYNGKYGTAVLTEEGGVRSA